jgi:nicotinamide-nucleotide amidase
LPGARIATTLGVLVRIEIVNTGSELMLGRVLNTHQFWLCRQLSDRGCLVQRQTAVDDTAECIRDAVREALGRSDLVIATGGLGPTSDDRTRDVLAAMLGRSLHEDPAVVAHIERWFESRNRVAPPGTRIQAQVPNGAVVLHNAHGTAPGLLIEVRPNPCRADGGAAWLVLLPGPPRELRPMFTDQVLPWLQRTIAAQEPFVCRTLRSTGIGESQVQHLIAAPLEALVAAGLDIGYCARPGEVDVRLAARGSNAERKVTEAVDIVLGLIGAAVYGQDEDSLEAVVVRALTQRRQTLAVAESCTGGRLASRITDVPGASAVFVGGAVTYSNALKEKLLGVGADTLAEHGAVSEPVAQAMANGARERLGADYALSITGIAGPAGGTEAKPVGTVFIGLATPNGARVRPFVNRFDRETFKAVTTQQALELLRREVAG